MKLGLGTVQFGTDYGVSNHNGQVSNQDIAEIFQLATKHGINTLDTAHHYGTSEQVLKPFLAQAPWQVITKSKTPCHSTDELVKSFDLSLKRLATTKVNGFLLHDANDINTRGVYSHLVELKNSGKVNKIGASFYCPNQLIKVLDSYPLDIIQVPVNLFDQRFIDKKIIEKIQQQGIELHVRSAFLQGLLLMPKDSQPKYFSPYKTQLEAYHQFLTDKALSPLQACLSFVKNISQIDKIIVGCCNKSQLNEIINCYKTDISFDGTRFASNSEGLINPSHWK